MAGHWKLHLDFFELFSLPFDIDAGTFIVKHALSRRILVIALSDTTTLTVTGISLSASASWSILDCLR